MNQNAKTEKEIMHESMRLMLLNNDFSQGVKKAYNYLWDNSAEFRDFCSNVSIDDMKTQIGMDIENALMNMLIMAKNEMI